MSLRLNPDSNVDRCLKLEMAVSLRSMVVRYCKTAGLGVVRSRGTELDV